MGIDNQIYHPENIDFVVVQSGEVCTPCSRLSPLLGSREPLLPTLRSAASDPAEAMTLIVRNANEGMDFAAHNATISYVTARNRLEKYKYFFLLNSSIRGPFFPSYMPPGWQWTQAFTDRLRNSVGVVSSSIVCLPEVDAGGYGPKLESWAAATDRHGLGILVEEGVFEIRTCKTCTCVADGLLH